MKLLTLGRNTQLSLAELTSLYGPVQLHSSKTALVDQEDVDFARLGGSIKCGTVKEELDTTDPAKIWLYLSEHFDEFLGNKASQQNFGVSFYGASLNPDKYRRRVFGIKQALQKKSLKVRAVLPSSNTKLSSAEVFHNQLAASGIELLVSLGQTNTVIAQTTDVQNLDRYRHRDRDRPKPDPKVGMLPPKLAQIMVNLANPEPGGWVLDPFCGTGTVLQEALLGGFNAYGSDIDARMRNYTSTNLSWLRDEYDLKTKFEVIQADATQHTWLTPITAVVSEMDLGPPLKKAPSKNRLDELVQEADDLLTAFLNNLATQLKPGTPVCLAVPAWLNTQPPTTPGAIDHLGDFGYNHKRLTGVNAERLLYQRADQQVGRKLLVLAKD